MFGAHAVQTFVGGEEGASSKLIQQAMIQSQIDGDPISDFAVNPSTHTHPHTDLA